MATLEDDPKAAQLYNDALELGTRGKWYPFLALAYQLIAEQYIRRNMRMLAMPMLQEALDMYNAVDAWGVHITCPKSTTAFSTTMTQKWYNLWM